MKRSNFIKLILLLFIGIGIVSCKKDKQEDSLSLIERHGLSGTFTAQITPTFMGTNPITSDEHSVYFEDAGNGRLRMHYEKFRASPMPFEMSVDIIMTVKAGPDNTVLFEGGGGTFKAEPPNGEEIDPNDIPEGIQLPEESLGGLSSDKATITGTYAEVEKEGQKAWRYDLKLTPGIPLPIEVVIYSKHKN